MSEDCKSVPESNIELKAEPFNMNGLSSSIFYNKFSGLMENYESNIVFDSNRQVDMDLLNQNTELLNNFIRSESFKVGSVVFSTLYPKLSERLSNNFSISPFETQRIIETNLIVPDIFGVYIVPSNASRVLSQVENYYTSGSVSGNSMGSFCSLVGNVFAAFNGNRDVFNDITGFADDFFDTIQKIQNFSLEGFAIAALLEKLKENVLSVVDKLVAKVTAKLANFSSAFMVSVGSFRSSTSPIAEKITTTKSKIEDFLSDDVIENLKKKIEGLISYTISLFEDPSLEVIQFMILRFCEFIGEMEGFFNNLTTPLDNIAKNFQNTYQQLQSSGNAATSRALAAGAVRYQPQQRNSGIDTSRQVPSSPSPVSIRQRAENILPPTAQEIDELPSWEELSSGKNKYFTYSSSQGRIGWSRAETREKVMLLRLAKLWGTRFDIKSAYRTKEFNDSLKDAAKYSQHRDGRAFDINQTSDDFVRAALSVGFGGIGRYATFTHIDSRPYARWDQR